MKKSNKILMSLATVAFAALLSSKSYAVHFYDTLDTKYEGATERLAELNIISGVSKNVFEPNRTVTRAEFAKMMVTAALKPAEYEALISDDAEITFKDINREKKEWYYDYVTVAVNAGFMKGYEDGTFRPDNDISYAEIAKMITIALGHDYLRADDPRGWEAEYVDKMYEIGGFRNTYFLSTSDKATRGNVAIMIWNMLNTTTWKMVYRNDTYGFSYVDSNQTLFSQKIIDHEALKDAKIQGYKEINGQIYVTIQNRNYKLFDQDATYDFSTIGGTSDVLLKRVEYPGEIVKMEAIGISTDIGATLYEGTYKELQKEGFDLSNKVRMSDDTDYAYLYHYENEAYSDRAIGIKWNEIYYVEEVKVDDERPKDKEEKLEGHSQVKNQFEDDPIAYRYEKSDDVLTRTITINQDELVINDGALLFKNNQRINWKDLKKGDILVEIAKNQYYFIATTTSKDAVLRDYDTSKDNYSITTSIGTFKTYANTKYTTYYSNDVLKFNKLKASELDKLKDKRVRLTFDVADRVVRIDALEDQISYKSLNFGIFVRLSAPVGKDGEQLDGSLYLLQDGKEKKYLTQMTSVSAEKGDLVKYAFDDKKTHMVKSVTVIKGKVELSDKIKLEKFKTSDLQNIAKYFEDEELKITRIKYHYAFGKYEEPTGCDVEKINLATFLGVKDDVNTTAYGMLDSEDALQEIYLVDHTEKSTTYFGVVNRIYKKTDDKDNNIHVKVKVVGVKEEQDYVLNGMILFEEGDFIKFTSVKGDTLDFIEKYSLTILGYYKDIEVTGNVYDAKGRVLEGYETSQNGTLRIKEWTLKTDEDEYNLNAFDVFLITLSKANGSYAISNVSVVTSNKISLEKGDMIAINEIDDAIIIYRGFTK